MGPLKTRRVSLPTSDADGNVLANYGKRHGECVAVAFEMIGGMDCFSDWASKNRGEFYTKIWQKTIPKEVEHKAHDSIEALLDRLDQKTIDVVPTHIDEHNIEDVE